MAIPFLQEANVDGLIKVLRVTGTIRDDVSADAVRQLHNGLTETEMNTIIGTLNLGGSGGRYIASPGDAFALVDTDALPAPRESKVNFFRVLRWQDNTTVYNPYNLMLGVYWPKSTIDAVDLVVGPDTGALMSHWVDNKTFKSRLYLGAYRTSGQAQGYSKLEAGPDACVGDFEGTYHYNNTNWMDHMSRMWHRFYQGTEDIYTGDDDRLPPVWPPPVMVGGFGLSDNNPLSWVGDLQSARTVTVSLWSDALVTTKTDNGWKTFDNSTDAYKWINFKGRDPNFLVHVMVNGDDGPTPDIRRTPNEHERASFTVFGADDNNDCVCSLVGIYDAGYTGEVLLLQSYDPSVAATYDFIRAQKINGTWNTVFRVTNIGDVRADGTFVSGGADVAEWVPTTEQYPYGVVLVVAADGTFVQSTEEEDLKVVGVVARKPGMEFGRGMGDTTPEGKCPMTVCGITPVLCTTIAGNIEAGDRIVSSTDGRAQKAGATPAVGTVLGKALGTLEQLGDDPELGEVSCLIILQ